MRTSKKASSQRQIEAAIVLFHTGKLDCAITLAAAGEGILRTPPDPHLRQQLQPYHQELDLNLVANWLKHPGEPDVAEIGDFEAVVMIVRAITKFVAVYHQSCETFERFLEWARDAGHPMGRERPNSN